MGSLRVASNEHAEEDDLPITWPFRFAGLCLLLSLAYFCAGFAVEDLEYHLWGHLDVFRALLYIGFAAMVLGGAYNIYREQRRRKRLA